MPRPRRLRSRPVITLALAWLPALAGSMTLAGGASGIPSARAAPPPETSPPTRSRPPARSNPSPSANTATVRARTSPSSSTPPAPPGGAAVAPSAPATTPEPAQDLSGTWGYSRTHRRPRQHTPRYVRSDDPTHWAAPNPIGFYSGVSVAGNHMPPRPPHHLGSKPVMLTWAGFERAHEGSRVFLQLSAEADYHVHNDGLVLVIRMRNTRVNVRNNLRALDLRYFKTPVRSVKVRRKGRDTVARIVLKHAAEPTISLVDGKEGYKLLVVQFDDAMARPQQRVDPTQKPRGAMKVQPLPASSGS